MSDSLQRHGLQSTRVLCPWDFSTRIPEWVAMPSSRGSSQPRDQTHISYIFCIGRWIFYHESHLRSPLPCGRHSKNWTFLIQHSKPTIHFLLSKKKEWLNVTGMPRRNWTCRDQHLRLSFLLRSSCCTKTTICSFSRPWALEKPGLTGGSLRQLVQHYLSLGGKIQQFPRCSIGSCAH